MTHEEILNELSNHIVAYEEDEPKLLKDILAKELIKDLAWFVQGKVDEAKTPVVQFTFKDELDNAIATMTSQSPYGKSTFAVSQIENGMKVTAHGHLITEKLLNTTQNRVER